MNHDHQDRMAATRRRGPRPQEAPEPEAPTDQPPAPVVAGDEMPADAGARCCGCGRMARLRRERQGGGKAYATCPLCGARNHMARVGDHWVAVRLVG